MSSSEADEDEEKFTPTGPSEPEVSKKREALKANPKGVRVALSERLESNKSLLAGYLGLNNTKNLRNLEAREPIKTALQTWLASRQSNFGCNASTGNKNGTVPIS